MATQNDGMWILNYVGKAWPRASCTRDGRFGIVLLTKQEKVAGFIPEISIPGFVRLLKAAYPEALPDFNRAVKDLPAVKAKKLAQSHQRRKLGK